MIDNHFGQIRLEFIELEKCRVFLGLYNIHGINIYNEVIDLREGWTLHFVDAWDFNPGTYFVRIERKHNNVEIKKISLNI